MKTRHIGRIVAGCLIGGVAVALALILGPVAGAQEHVITGTILLTFAASWALLGTLSTRWTDQPQRWAFAPAAFMGVAAAALLVFAPNGEVVDALGWVWPPLFLALLAGTIGRVHRDLHSRSRVWLVYPLLGVYALCALGGGYETVREALDGRNIAPGQLVDVGGHRLHLRCAGSGTPTVLLESGLGETAAYWGWISPAVATDTRVCVYDRAGRGWSDPVSLPQDGVAVATDLHISAGPRERSRSVRARRPFVRRAVRQDLRRPVSRTGGRHGPARRPACGSVRGTAVLSDVLPRVPSHLRCCCRRWLASASDESSFKPTPALPATARDMQRVHHASAAPLSQPARRVRGTSHLARAGPIVSEPRRPAAGRRHRCAGSRRRDGCRCRTGWRRCPRTAATASCPIPMTRSSPIRPPHKRQSSAIRDVVHAVRSNVPLDKS